MDRDEGLRIVREAIADGLDLDPDEVRPESRLFTELGADSLDYLELVFTLEQAFGVKLARSELDFLSRLDWSDPGVLRDGLLTPPTLEKIRRWLPAAADLAPEEATPQRLWSLVTVETVWQAVARRMGES